MPSKNFWNIRRTLTVLLILAFIPFLIIFISTVFIDAKKIYNDKKYDFLNEVRFIAESENNIDAIHAILKTLSLEPSFKKFNQEEIHTQFKSLVEKTGLFHNLLLVDPNGNYLLSAIDVGNIGPASDRLYFRRAIETKDFSFGEFAISRSTGKPVIHFAMPVISEKGNIISVIIAVPVMEKILPEFNKLPLSAFLLDEKGIIVKSSDGKNIGKKYDNYEKILNVNEKNGVLSIKEHITAFSKIKINKSTFATIVMETPLSLFSILVERGFFSKTLLIFIVFLISIILANLVSRKLIIVPLRLIENHLKQSFEVKQPVKIEDSFSGELETFREVYNRFIDTIHQKNEELKQERNFWLNIFNDIPDPVFLVDKDYKITVANESFLNTFKLKLEDIKDLHCYDICHKTKSPIDFCPHRTILEKNISTSMEAFFPELSKWFIITFTCFCPSEQLQGTIHIFKDITELKYAEEEKIRIERQLLHTQKLESLGILAGGIAHDFNNLLMGILGNAELALINKESLPTSVIQNIETIKKITEKAAHLTRQMLAYSGKGRFIIKEIELNSFIKEIFELIRVSISKKAAISLNLNEKEPLLINGDPGQIEQVILNLVINASEALEEKEGLITITTGKQFCDSKYFDNTIDGGIRQFKEGEYVYFEITDTGCGMDKETMGKIFEPFFTTKFTGRGLGLSAILGIVRGHNGAIRVYSEKGKGTSFKILFPAIKPTPKSQDAKEEYQSLKDKTFLIIDDEEVVREVSKKMVELLGGKAFIAKDGKEGIEIFKNNDDQIDYILLDLTMPGLSGEEVFRELKKIKENIYVILMSGYNDQDVSQRLVGKGFAGFIQKPFTIHKLLEVFKAMKN